MSAGDPARRTGLWPDLAPWRSSRGFRLLFASRTVIALGTQASEVPRLVRREQLTAASALLSLSQNACFLLGSALGGALAVAPGPWLVYGIDAVGFATSFGLLTLLPGLAIALSAAAWGLAIVSGGFLCAGAVAVIAALLPGFIRPGNGGCPAAQGSAGHRADGVLGRPVPTQGNDMKADKDRKILSV